MNTCIATTDFDLSLGSNWLRGTLSMSRFCRCRFGWHPEWSTSEKTCQCRTKSISTDRESSGDTWWWLEGLVCGENFASAHGKLTQDYSRILLPAIRSFSWCLIDCPRTRDHALMAREVFRDVEQVFHLTPICRDITTLSLLKPSLRLSTMIFMWMLSKRAPVWNDISFKCVCVTNTRR